jgi:hypothetical protein
MRERAASLHTPFAVELRAAVLQCGGWVADDEGGVTREGGVPNTAAPLARGAAGHRLFLLEVAPGEPFPPQAERARRLDDLGAGGSGNVLVVGDAAGVRRIWCWRSARHPAVWPYREADHPADDVEVAELVRGVAEELRRPPPSGRVQARVGALLQARLGGSPSARSPLEAIEHASTPAASRRALQILRSLQVIDMACGDGTGLLEAAAALEPYHLAALSRLEGWARDARGGSPRRGEERVPPGAAAAGERVRCAVLLHNLFGVCGGAVALRIARLRLAAWVVQGEPGRAARDRVPGVVCRLVASEAPPGTARGAAAEPHPQHPFAAGTRELRRAWEIVRDLDLARGAELPELTHAYRDLAARRADLLRRRPVAARRADPRHRADEPFPLLDPMLASNPATTLFLQPEPRPVP